LTVEVIHGVYGQPAVTFLPWEAENSILYKPVRFRTVTWSRKKPADRRFAGHKTEQGEKGGGI
jgi:hypothetical protein